VAVALLTGWIFPKTPFYGQLVLLSAEQAEKGFVVKSAETVSVGMRGTATSMLRPSGRARINDITVQVVARGDYIDAGTPIVVVQTDGNRYVVDIVKDGGA
jgi:membrane-bound serine protease (ClpP class)